MCLYVIMYLRNYTPGKHACTAQQYIVGVVTDLQTRLRSYKVSNMNELLKNGFKLYSSLPK